jgi:hypothetical protein
MAFPSVTYSFSNGTAADADQVNQNFTDLINGMSDGLKDLNVFALTSNSTGNFKGNNTFGASSSNTITMNGRLITDFVPSSTNTRDLGTSSLYFAEGYITTLYGAGIVPSGSAFVINEAGADKDFRIEGDADQNLFFLDAGTDRAGIGTSTLTEKFHVNGSVLFQGNLNSLDYDAILFDSDTTSNLSRIIAAGATAGDTPKLQLGTAINGSLINAITIDSAGLVGIGSGAGTPTSELHIRKDQNSSTVLRVQNETAGSVANARLTLDADGGVCELFKASNSWSSGAGGADTFNIINESAGVFLAVADTAWSAISDERSKENWKEIQNPFDIIKDWGAGIYNLKGTPESSKKVGLIAQEVIKTLPEVVNTTNPDQFSIRYTEIIPVLVAIIINQENRLAGLENR